MGHKFCDGALEVMKEEVRIPDIGDADEVYVIELCVAPGDAVGPDDALIVIESDKASMEVPAGVGGVVDALLVAVDDAVAEGQAIARIDAAEATAGDAEAGSDAAAEAQAAETERAAEAASADNAAAAVRTPSNARAGKEAASAQSAAQPDAAASLQTGQVPASTPGSPADAAKAGARQGSLAGSPSLPESGAASPQTRLAPAPGAALSGSEGQGESPGARVYAGPATRRLARELGAPLAEVTGSGAGGRILKDDVKRYVKGRLTAPASGGGLPALPEVDFAKFGEIEVAPLSRIRAAGAQNLHRSWLNLPHVTQHDEADVTELEALRALLKAEAAQREVSLSPLPFIVKACCLALQAFPTFNASLDRAAANYILKRYYNIGVAVDTEQGLVVPVIKGVDGKGVWELAAEIADLAAKARNQRLPMNAMQGGTFSVSSLGAIGGTGFTPIINAPEVAILGVGRLATKPVWDQDAFRPRKMLPLSLSYDHRAINGAEAGRFAAHLSELLAAPEGLAP